MATTTRRRAADSKGGNARSTKAGTKPRTRSDTNSGASRSRAELSTAAQKAWETRRANGWQHPKKVRSLTPKEIAAASGVTVAKVQRVLELASKRVPAATPAAKGR